MPLEPARAGIMARSVFLSLLTITAVAHVQLDHTTADYFLGLPGDGVGCDPRSPLLFGSMES